MFYGNYVHRTYHQGFCLFWQQHDFFCAINIDGQCQFKFFIETNGGRCMENNLNIFDKFSTIRLGYTETRQTAITFDWNDFVAVFFFFVLLLQLGENLLGKSSERGREREKMKSELTLNVFLMRLTLNLYKFHIFYSKFCRKKSINDNNHCQKMKTNSSKPAQLQKFKEGH